jgi:hypothetical protein
LRISAYDPAVTDDRPQQVIQLFVRHQARIKGFILSCPKARPISP